MQYENYHSPYGRSIPTAPQQTPAPNSQPQQQQQHSTPLQNQTPSPHQHLNMEAATPLLLEAIKDQFMQALNERLKEYKQVSTKLASRQATLKKLKAHRENNTLPSDLRIKFDGNPNFPHTIGEEERRALQNAERTALNNTLREILQQRITAYEEDLFSLTTYRELISGPELFFNDMIAKLPILRNHKTYVKTHVDQIVFLMTKHDEEIINAELGAPRFAAEPDQDKMDDQPAPPVANNLTVDELKKLIKDLLPKHPQKPKNKSGHGRGNTQRGRSRGRHHVQHQRSNSRPRSNSRGRSRSRSSTRRTRSRSFSGHRNKSRSLSNHSRRSQGRGRGRGRAMNRGRGRGRGPGQRNHQRRPSSNRNNSNNRRQSSN